MNSVDKLLYKKANTYRLHADNLRWTLLGGYGAFVAALMLQIKDVTGNLDFRTVALFFILFCVSILYLFILAVQSWYYNLFSEYVEYCENKIVREERLVSLSDFTELDKENVSEKIKVKNSITPLHPSFSFALYVVALTSMGFLFPVVQFVFSPYSYYFQQHIGITSGLLAFFFLFT